MGHEETVWKKKAYSHITPPPLSTLTPSQSSPLLSILIAHLIPWATTTLTILSPFFFVVSLSTNLAFTPGRRGAGDSVTNKKILHRSSIAGGNGGEESDKSTN